MGDEKFFAMLSDLQQKFLFKPLSTAEFQTHAAAYVPEGYPDRKLDILFEQYVEDIGIPELDMKHKVAAVGNKWRVQGVVTQKGVAEDFSIFAPVEIRAGRTSTVHWVRTDAEGAEFTVTVPFRPTSVELNPRQMVLAR